MWGRVFCYDTLWSIVRRDRALEETNPGLTPLPFIGVALHPVRVVLSENNLQNYLFLLQRTLSMVYVLSTSLNSS